MTPQDQLPQVDSELTPAEKYWAAKAAQDVVSVLKTKEDEFFQALRRRGLMRMWRVMWAQYYGQDPDAAGGFETQMISVAGEDGELLTFRLQKVRQYITRQIQMAAGERAAFQCHAVNTDYSTRAQINTCDSIIEYVYREAHAERRERDILESDSNFGSAAGWVRWDAEKGDEVQLTEQQPIPGDMTGATAPVKVSKRSGAPSVTVLYPWQLIQERSTTDHLWREVRERTSRWEVMAQRPELAEKIRAIRGLDEYTTEALFGYDTPEQDGDDIIVKHFYHARCAAMPDGRYLGFVGDIVLWDLPCPVSKGMPIQDMCSELFIGSSFGYASGWDLIAPNQLIDQIWSDAASNLATFGRQVIGVPQGTDFDVDALANGHRVLILPTGAEPPVPLNFAGIPEAARWSLEILGREMDGISGINAAAQGNPEFNVTSGTYAALLHAIAIEFQAPRQSAFDWYREGMANLMLDMVRQRASAPFLIEVAGIEERPYLQSFTSDTLSGVKRVVVKTANPMMRSQAGRMEIFQVTSQIPNPADRAAAIELITTGNWKDFAKFDRSKEMAIVWENEQLAQGQPVPISEFDDPILHLQKHAAEFQSRREEFMQNPQLMAVYVQHMRDHEMAWDTLYSPTRCAWMGIPVSPNAQMQMQMQPANTNAGAAQQPAPEGAMGGDPAQAMQHAGAGGSPSDPALAAGVQQPQPAQPAQPPGGQPQNQGEAA